MYWQPRSVYEEAQTGLHGGSADESAGQGRKVQASKCIFLYNNKFVLMREMFVVLIVFEMINL